jgi:hypothetical protein
MIKMIHKRQMELLQEMLYHSRTRTVSIIHETTSNVESDPTGSSTPIAGPTDSPDNAESPDRE